jgi:hypothetical protein
MLPLVRHDAELVAGGMAAVAIFAFLGVVLVTTALELVTLIANVVAATSG